MDHVQQQPRRPGGRAALGWAVFVVIAMLVTAAVIAGAIRGGLAPPAQPSSGALPSLPRRPSPAPAPLPKPGPAPPATELAAL